jgi:uncharacterized membrane protein YbhN (UPF0104 family)
MKKYRKLILKILVSGALLWFIFYRIDKATLVENFRLLDVRFIPLIVLLIIVNYIVSSVRWKKLLIYENTSHVTVGYLTSLYFIGSFFNNFMPTSIGGDVYKIFKLSKKIGSAPNAFSATFMERFSGVVVLMLISLFSTVKFVGWWTLLLFVGFILAFFAGLFVLRFLSTKNKKLKEMYTAMVAYKNNGNVLVFAAITSLIVQLMSLFSQYFIFVAIGAELPIFHALLVFPLITLASFFIPSLNGLGVQDYLYMNLFSTLSGIPVEISLSASILYHFFRLGVSLIGGVLYAMGKSE